MTTTFGPDVRGRTSHEVHWHTTTPLGGSSRGVHGTFDSASEAEAQAVRLNGAAPQHGLDRPAVETSYHAVRVYTDAHGNREEY